MIKLKVETEQATAGYGGQRLFNMCINKCPFKRGFMVGSMACKSCEYISEYDDTVVYCTYNERLVYKLPEGLFEL